MRSVWFLIGASMARGSFFVSSPSTWRSIITTGDAKTHAASLKRSAQRSSTLSPVHFQSAIDREALSGHVVGVFGGKIERETSHFPRLSRPSPRDIRQLLLALVRIVNAGLCHGSTD